MKILFVSTVAVFPPKDGVRIPPANYVLGLSKTHDVDFLLLDTQREDRHFESDCAATREYVRRFFSVKIRRGPKFAGLVREIFRKGPYYGYWEQQQPLPDELATDRYDSVFACTPAAIAMFSAPEMRQKLSGNPRWIAAISDIHSLVLSQLARNASKNHRLFARTVQKFLYACRSKALASSEMNMLDRYDFHLVQTDKEAAWVRQQGTAELQERTVQLPNAVSDRLFELPTERDRKKMAFVGVLSDLYAGRFEWFIHNVWKAVDANNSELSLTAIGRTASESLQQTMRDHDVEYIDFVENLEDIYADHDILVAPIYKGFGLINKVVEAMAAGCVVVGDTTAFNGIPEFEAGKHGFVANTAEEFCKVLSSDFQDGDKLNDVRQAARELMEKHFRWSQRIDRLNREVLSTANN